MNNTFTMKAQKQKNGTDSYLTQKILCASPSQLIVYIYDAAIVACVQRDKEKVLRAIQELINSLDFEKGKSVTGIFYQMYRHLLEQIRKDNFDEVKSVLTEIRRTWSKAMKVY